MNILFYRKGGLPMTFLLTVFIHEVHVTHLYASVSLVNGGSPHLGVILGLYGLQKTRLCMLTADKLRSVAGLAIRQAVFPDFCIFVLPEISYPPYYPWQTISLSFCERC